MDAAGLYSEPRGVVHFTLQNAYTNAGYSKEMPLSPIAAANGKAIQMKGNNALSDAFTGE